MLGAIRHVHADSGEVSLVSSVNRRSLASLLRRALAVSVLLVALLFANSAGQVLRIFIPLLVVLLGLYMLYFRREIAQEHEELVQEHKGKMPLRVWPWFLHFGTSNTSRYYASIGIAATLVGLLLLAISLYGAGPV